VWQSVVDRLDGPVSIRARVLRADGTLGPTQTLAQAPSGGEFGTLEHPLVGADDVGDAIFAWSRAAGHGPILQARWRGVTGRLGPVSEIGPGAGELAVTPGGRATFGWVTDQGIFARTVTTQSRGSVRQVSTSTQTGDLHVVSGGGTVLFSWRQATADDARIMAREETSGGSLTQPQVIARGDLASSLWKTAAVGPDGTAAFCWFPAGAGRSLVLGRIRSPSGTLGPVETINPDGGCLVDVDSSGNVVFAGTVTTGDKQRAFARTQPAGGTLGPMHLLSPAGYTAFNTQLDVNDAGEAAVVWTLGNRGFAVQGAVGP
jgi:hypothetical protein